MRTCSDLCFGAPQVLPTGCVFVAVARRLTTGCMFAFIRGTCLPPRPRGAPREVVHPNHSLPPRHEGWHKGHEGIWLLRTPEPGGSALLRAFVSLWEIREALCGGFEIRQTEGLRVSQTASDDLERSIDLSAASPSWVRPCSDADGLSRPRTQTRHLGNRW